MKITGFAEQPFEQFDVGELIVNDQNLRVENFLV
jgi:hypothetical protein